MKYHKYYIDPNDLKFKKLIPSKKRKNLLFLSVMVSAALLAVSYGFITKHWKEVPKEKRLNAKIEKLKFEFELLNRDLESAEAVLEHFTNSDENVYRPILEMDTLPDDYRRASVGGVERYAVLSGYPSSHLMRSTRAKLDNLNMRIGIQHSSFGELQNRQSEWADMLEHIPSICPLQNMRVSDKMGVRAVHPVLGVTTYHNGVDFRASVGTEVYAPGDGIVSFVGYNGGYGKCVIIDHGYGYKTIYGHLSDYRVSEGQNVYRGDLICLTGNTGTSTGPHLHYEIRQFDKVKNPMNYFENDISEEEYEEMIWVLNQN